VLAVTEGLRVSWRGLATALTLFALTLLLVLGLAPRAPADASGFREFPIAEAGFSPSQITSGPDGRLWYTTEQQGIEAITTAGTPTAYSGVGTGAGSSGIADSPNGTLAFLQGTSGNYPGGSITEASTAGALAHGPSALQGSGGVSLTTGPDGNLWYVAPGYVCRIDPSLDPATQSCVALDQQSPGTSVGATSIATGSDQSLWVTEADLDAIVKVNPALPPGGALTSYPLPAHGATSRPFDIVAGPDGALWFGEILGNRIGRITTTGQITEYDLPNANSDPEGIAQGPDGAIWFAEQAGDRIGRITTGGQITEYPVPTPNSRPTAIVTGPDGALWFTEAGAARIGRYLPTASAPPPTTSSSSSTTTGSSTAPGPPPVPSLAVVGGGPVVGHVVALNPGGSHAETGSITGYAYDLDGSGAFATTCPVSTPVAYKMFDTPGSHVIGLRVTDSSGLTSTTHIAVTVAPVAGASTRARSRHVSASLTNLSQFWCGSADAASRGSLAYLDPLFASEVHAVGIDVTQGVVPDPPRPTGLTLIDRILAIHGGVFSGGSGRIFLNNDEQDPGAHKISWLQQFGTTVVRVYASSLLAPNNTDVPNVQMKLYGFRDGHELPGSPLLSQTGPLDVKVGPPFTTHAMRIGYSPAAGTIPAFTYTLPADWVDQSANMSLLAVPTLVGPRLDRQCATLPCRLAEQTGTSFQLNSTGLLIIRSVAMESTAQINATAGAPSFPTPAGAFDAAANLAPVAVLASPYQSTINIDSITKCKAGDKTTPCTNPNGYATTLIGNWLTANQPVIPATVKVATIGVHNGYSQINGYSGWPNGCSDNANGGALCESSTSSPVSQVDAGRPLTSVAHEMFHDLGRPHADAVTGGCGGGGEGQPDAKGHMQAIGLDRHPGSGGSVTTPYKLISSDLPTQPTNRYDLMSYCTDNYPETDSWLSAHTWDAVASDWIFFLKRAAQAVLASALKAQPAGSSLRITALSEGPSTAITQIEPATADTGAGGAGGAGGASPPASSPYHAVLRDKGGAVVGEAALTATYGHLDGPGHSTPVALLSGTVPGGGADQAQVTFNGSVIATMHRSLHAPAVDLIAPRRGTIGAGHRVLIRWSARDADGGVLTSSVDYSTNGGRGWRTVYTGPDTGLVSLPSSYFSGARDARVRVRISDGFNESSAASARLRALGSPPTVTILSLRSGQRITADASTLLRGMAFDDRFARLSGQQLTWFAGPRRIGTGEMVSVTGLPPGAITIRLQGRDRRGRAGSATVRVRVIGVRPFFTTLVAPSNIRLRTRQLRLRVATNLAATLRIGKLSFRLTPRPRTLTVSIKPGNRALRLTLNLSEHRARATQTLAITRR
jgi:streptogramin lyase